MTYFKDKNLYDLMKRGCNVARFVSISPSEKVRYHAIKPSLENSNDISLTNAIEALFEAAPSGLVNIRSFDPIKTKGNPFVMKISSIEETVSIVKTNAGNGLFSIVNEYIEPNDGGINGVSLGNLIEFGTDCTARTVDLAGAAQLDVMTFTSLVQIVYGFVWEMPGFSAKNRVEFSIHPQCQGYYNQCSVFWEEEAVDQTEILPADIRWPNKFSALLGDKVYGLLIAHLLGIRVPQTTVISRKIAPFHFGTKQDFLAAKRSWLRTAPAIQTPGKFSTVKGWIDPFKLLMSEDPTGEFISSVLHQEGVIAVQAGACIPSFDPNEGHIIEAVDGEGDKFMVGHAGNSKISPQTLSAVELLKNEIITKLGDDIAFEWVFDGVHAWVVQLHRKKPVSSSKYIYKNLGYPGPTDWQCYHVSDGLEGLRSMANELQGKSTGIILKGQVGVTSHFGDILRQAKIPSKIEN